MPASSHDPDRRRRPAAVAQRRRRDARAAAPGRAAIAGACASASPTSHANGPFSRFPGVAALVRGARGRRRRADDRHHASIVSAPTTTRSRSAATSACAAAWSPAPTRDLNLMLRGVRRGDAPRRSAARRGGPRRANAASTRPAPARCRRDRARRAARRCRRTRLRWWPEAPGVARLRRRAAGGSRAGRERHGRAMTTTLWRDARLVTIAERAAGAWSSAARCSSTASTIAWVGAEDDLPAALRADAELDLGGALVTPGPDRLPHPPRLRRPARAASSSSGCKARATRRSRAPAAASARPWRRRARRATTRLFASARARALALMARRRDDARDQVRLRPVAPSTRRAACASRAGSAASCR